MAFLYTAYTLSLPVPNSSRSVQASNQTGVTVNINNLIGTDEAAVRDQLVPILNRVYQLALNRTFDIYEQLKKFCLFFTRILRFIHTGILTTYLIWILLGMLVLFFVLMG